MARHDRRPRSATAASASSPRDIAFGFMMGAVVAASLVAERTNPRSILISCTALVAPTIVAVILWAAKLYDRTKGSKAASTSDLPLGWPSWARLQALGAIIGVTLIWAVVRAQLVVGFALPSGSGFPLDEIAATIAILSGIWGVAALPPRVVAFGPAAVFASAYGFAASALRGRSAAVQFMPIQEFVIDMFVGTTVACLVLRSFVRAATKRIHHRDPSA